MAGPQTEDLPSFEEGGPLDIGTVYLHPPPEGSPVQQTGAGDERQKLQEMLDRLKGAGATPSIQTQPPTSEPPASGVTPPYPAAPPEPAAEPGPLQARAQAMTGNFPAENMSPDRAALARSVFGMGEKGAAYLDQKAAAVQQTLNDMPRTLPEFLDKASQPENMRGILRGSGAAIGGMVGQGGGPAGVVVGTGTGSALGSYMANVYDSVRNYVQGTDSPDKPALAKQLLQPMIDGAHDAAFTGAVISVPGAVRETKVFLARVLRVGPQSRELMNEAATLGVDIGIANVANGGVGKGAVNVFGRMPFLGTSAKKASLEQGKAVVKAYDDMFGAVANPTSSTEIGEAALAAARARYGDFAASAGKKFEHASRIGEEAGSFLSSDKVLKATGNVLQEMASKSGKLQGQVPAEIRTYLNGLVKNVGDTLTTNDISNISVGLQNLLRKSQGANGIHYSKLEQIQDALDATLKSSDHPAARLMLGAQKFFQDGLKDFETNIYQKMVGKVDRNIFALGKIKQGTMTADQLMETVEKATSVKAINEIRTAVGDDVIKSVARSRLDDAWVKATGQEPGTFFVGQKLNFDATRFKQALGLENPNGSKYAAMQEMLRGTGVGIQDVEKLARVAEAVTAAPIADASTFMARAAVLRGAGGISEAVKGAMMGGATGKLAATHGLPSAIAGVLMLRWGIGHMMKPGLLKMITEAGDVNLGNAVNAAAIIQMATQYPSLFNE